MKGSVYAKHRRASGLASILELVGIYMTREHFKERQSKVYVHRPVVRVCPLSDSSLCPTWMVGVGLCPTRCETVKMVKRFLLKTDIIESNK